MIWAVVQNIIRFVVEANQIERRIATIEEVFAEIEVKSKVVNKNLLKVKTHLINDLKERKKNYVSKNLKDFMKSRFVNHMGAKVFGEMWYIFKYGFVDNFFWNHPLLDAIAHNGPETKGFLLQWMTIYKLPPELRIVIKGFIKKNKTYKELQHYNNKYQMLYDELFSKFMRRQANVIINEKDMEDAMNEIENAFGDIASHHKKYTKLTAQTTKELITHCLSFNQMPTVEINAYYMKMILDDNPQEIIDKVLSMIHEEFKRNQKNISLGYFLSLYNIVSYCVFEPNSPETGNFYKAHYSFSNFSMSLFIHGTWYERQKLSYKFTMGVGEAQKCAVSPNIGKYYNENIAHRKVARPNRTAKRNNFNGSSVGRR